MALALERGSIGVGMAVLVALLVACGCGESTIPQKEAEDFVSAWSDRIDEILLERAAETTAETSFEKSVRRRAEEQPEADARDRPGYDVLVREAYEKTGWEFSFTSPSGLNDRGEQVLERLEGVDDHAISRRPSNLARIEELKSMLEQRDTVIESDSSFEFRDREVRAAEAIVARQKVGEFELNGESDGRLAAKLADHRRGERLRSRVEKLRPLVEERMELRGELERRMAEGILRYSRKMKHFRLQEIYVPEGADDFWTNPNTDGERPDEAKGPFVAESVRRRAMKIARSAAEPVEILSGRMVKTLVRSLQADDPTSVLDGLAPDHPQYDALKKEYVRYRSIVRDGGWAEVAPDWELEPGATDATVGELKRRLRVEGYYPEEAPIDDHYGAELESAVEAYQKTHQMKVDGRTHRTFWSSVNKPARERLNQLGLNMHRWRASDVRHSEPLYVRVNLPGFNLEVWKQQQLAMRFPVVIGDDERKVNRGVDDQEEEDEDEEDENPNHSPTFSAYIDRVIYNPFWNVTDRIRNQEILPKVRQSLEDSYTTKLRTLKAAVQKREAGSSQAGGSSESSSGEAGDESAAVEQGRTLASAGIGTNGDESEDADAEQRQREASEEGESRAMESPESGSSDESVAQDGEQRAESDATNQEGGGDSGEEASGDEQGAGSDEVTVDEFVAERIDAGETEEIYRDQIVFDVEAVESLLERAPAETRAAVAEFCPESERARPVESQRSEAAEETGGDRGGGCREGPSTSIGRLFPYLDRESGEVDVSTTDPDNIPEWYAKNRYEVKFPGQEWEYVRMLQGEKNALGRVKVIFPNPYAVYLHDTPKTHLFSRNIRAFSHGCMRMDKPLGMAEFLLREQGLYEEYDVEELLEGEEHQIVADSLEEAKKKPGVIETNDQGKKVRMVYEYKPIFLDRHVPVHVEYFTVRVGDRGRANFFLDVYDRDEEALSEDDYVAGL